jgi:hypothetical protein
VSASLSVGHSTSGAVTLSFGTLRYIKKSSWLEEHIHI